MGWAQVLAKAQTKGQELAAKKESGSARESAVEKARGSEMESGRAKGDRLVAVLVKEMDEARARGLAAPRAGEKARAWAEG